MAEYTIALITYFDILGFQTLIARRSASHIKSVLESLHQESKPDDELARLYSMKYFNFSDHIVRVTNLLARGNITAPTGLLFREVLSIVQMQANLVAEGVFIRGSLTVGNIYTGHGLIFGEGLNRAHELESQVAKYPRIVIDPRAFKLFATTPVLKAEWHTHKEELSYLRSSIRWDEDRVQFVDYLTSIGEEIDDPAEYAKFLMAHRGMIQKNRRRYKENPSVLEKYNWLRRYHNTIVDRLRSGFLTAHGLTRAKLRVPGGV
jgi:hypothetical protein